MTRSPRSDRTSPETLLALFLCGVVLLSSVAWVRGAPNYARSFADLPADPRLGFLSHQERFLQGERQRPPLLVLLALDGLRSDRLQTATGARAAAPNLSALAREAIAFTTAGAQSSQLLVSHKSLLTGKYPSTLLLEKTGADLLALTSIEAPREYLTTAFSGIEGTLAEGLRASGYVTAAFTGDGWLGDAGGFSHGFDTFDASGGGLGSQLEHALAWLDAHADTDRFLFVEASDLAGELRTNAPGSMTYCNDHSVHTALEELGGAGELSAADRRALADHYDGRLATLDEELGTFLAALEARGLRERALIVITSAGGTSLGERGVVGQGALYREQVVVPLVLSFPRAWEFASGTLDEPIELVDLLPTLFTLCDVDVPRDLDGRSLLPILFRGVRGKNVLVAQVTLDEGPEGANLAARSLLRPGRWQLIHDARHELASYFPLMRDPDGLEAIPIGPEEFPAFSAALLEGPRRTARARPRVPGRTALGDALERELEALGYAMAPGAGHP